MNSLLIFESKTLVDQLALEENKKLVKHVLNCFAELVRQYVNYRHAPAWDQFYETEVEESYLISMGESLEDTTIERTVTSDGNVSEWRHRFRELMDVCVEAFKDDLVSTLRSFKQKKETVVSVNVVDYDKFKMSAIVYTKVK